MILIALSLAALAQSNTVTLKPEFKVGDKVTYQMSMTEHLDSADADVEATWTETVKGTGANGVVEINAAYTDFHISANGMDIPAPPPESRTIDVPAGPAWMYSTNPDDESSVSHVLPDLFCLYATGMQLKLGLEATTGGFGIANASESRLEEIKNGIAKVTIKVVVGMPPDQVAKPMHVNGIATFTIADGKLQTFNGTILDLPPSMTKRYNVQSADFKLKRI